MKKCSTRWMAKGYEWNQMMRMKRTQLSDKMLFALIFPTDDLWYLNKKVMFCGIQHVHPEPFSYEKNTNFFLWVCLFFSSRPYYNHCWANLLLSQSIFRRCCREPNTSIQKPRRERKKMSLDRLLYPMQ